MNAELSWNSLVSMNFIFGNGKAGILLRPPTENCPEDVTIQHNLIGISPAINAEGNQGKLSSHLELHAFLTDLIPSSYKAAVS